MPSGLASFLYAILPYGTADVVVMRTYRRVGIGREAAADGFGWFCP
jgi:hypothetical protein